MITAFFKALGDIGSPRFRSVLWKSFFLSLATAIVIWAGLSWLIFNTDFVGVLPWIGGALETFIDIFGSVAAFLLMILLLPAALGIYASLYIETICRAVEARHYPDIAPPRDQGISEAVWVGLKFGALLIGLNLLLLPLLFFPPIYFVAGWGLNGYLLGREYLEMVGFRRMTPAELRSFRLTHKSTVYFAGLVFALIATVPIVNLLLPLFGTAMMLHVFERRRPKNNGINITISTV